MEWQAWVTLIVVGVTIVALVRDVARPDIVLLGSLGMLLLAGIVSPERAFRGFAHPAVLTIASLFVVAEGVRRSEALRFFDPIFFPRRLEMQRVLPRLMGSTAVLSAFLNNTPIVAMLMPRVGDWSKKNAVAASKLLIPLSYAAILGGMITLIGTSTNILVSGMLEAHGRPGFSMFELAWIGIPAAVAVVIYFALIGHRLLPDRRDEEALEDDGLTDCFFEVKIAKGSPFNGKTIRDSGLRSLREAYLFHIHRMGHPVPATPEEVLQEGDELTFVGDVQVRDQLLEMPGLVRSSPPLLQAAHAALPQFEAVVAESSELVGKTLRDVQFRENYHGVVVGIQRKNSRIGTSLGRTPIRAGDLLLVEAWNGFDQRWNRNRQEFYLVAPRRGRAERSRRSKKTPIALAIFALMIGSFVAGVLPLLTAAFLAALAMIASRCVTLSEARSSVDLTILVVIGAALGIGAAIESSGLAEVAAHSLTANAAVLGPLGLVAAVYIATNLLTELLTNNAAAVLMLPIVLAIGEQTQLDPHGLALTVAIAASASFMTPIGYQTNLMVMATGRYRFRDYVRAGLPVSIIVMTIAITSIYFLRM